MPSSSCFRTVASTSSNTLAVRTKTGSPWQRRCSVRRPSSSMRAWAASTTTSKIARSSKIHSVQSQDSMKRTHHWLRTSSVQPASYRTRHSRRKFAPKPSGFSMRQRFARECMTNRRFRSSTSSEISKLLLWVFIVEAITKENLHCLFIVSFIQKSLK